MLELLVLEQFLGVLPSLRRPGRTRASLNMLIHSLFGSCFASELTAIGEKGVG